MTELNKNRHGHYKRIVSFYDGQTMSSIFSVILAGLIFAFYRNKIQTEHYIWFYSHIFLSVLRIAMVKTFSSIVSEENETKALIHEKFYAALLMIVASAWGGVIHLFYPISLGIEQMLTVIFPLSVLVAGVTKMSNSKVAALSYTFGVIITFTSYFLTNWVNISPVMMFAGFLFALFMVTTSLTNYKNYFKLQDALSHQQEITNELEKNLNLEKELTKQKAMTLQSTKLASLGEMAAGIAHEINNPLIIIKLGAENFIKRIKKDKYDEEAAINTLQNISGTVDRVAKIVKGLLLFSRQGETLEKEEVCFEEVINECLSISHEKFKSNGIVIRKEGETHYPIYANKVSLSQVVINLLNNAFYYLKNKEERWVEIKVELNEMNNVIFTITDSGDPIPKEVQSRLFEPFFSTKPTGEGTGLGLSVSKSILKDHDGDLEYVDGEHPSFKLTIPLYYINNQQDDDKAA